MLLEEAERVQFRDQHRLLLLIADQSRSQWQDVGRKVLNSAV